MPILAAEPLCFPENLFADVDLRSDPERAWWVLHVRPRQEKSLARQLWDQSVPYFLPQMPRRSVIRGKVVESYVPLFTSYVFLWGTPDERVQALATRRVVHSLPVPDPVRLDQELTQIHTVLLSGFPVSPVSKLVPGAEVEIGKGPLAGLRGKILREGASNRFVVQVDFIQQGAAVELDQGYLTLLD